MPRAGGAPAEAESCAATPSAATPSAVSRRVGADDVAGGGIGLAPPGLGRFLPPGRGRVLPLGAGRVLPLGASRVLPLGAGRVLPLGRGRVLSLGAGRILSLGAGRVLSLGLGDCLSLGARGGVPLGAGVERAADGVRPGRETGAAKRGELERAGGAAARGAVGAEGGERMAEQRQQRRRRPAFREHGRNQPQEHGGGRVAERLAGAVVGEDAEAAELGRHASRERAVGSDQRRLGAAVLDRVAQHERDRDRLLLLVGGDEQAHAVDREVAILIDREVGVLIDRAGRDPGRPRGRDRERTAGSNPDRPTERRL